eukprot:9003564-Pyramimonas_sp.AAC.1
MQIFALACFDSLFQDAPRTANHRTSRQSSSASTADKGPGAKRVLVPGASPWDLLFIPCGFSTRDPSPSWWYL